MWKLNNYHIGLNFDIKSSDIIIIISMFQEIELFLISKFQTRILEGFKIGNKRANNQINYRPDIWNNGFNKKLVCILEISSELFLAYLKASSEFIAIYLHILMV